MKVFISYASADDRKRRALARAMETANPSLTPIVISSRGDPGRPLSDKVADGLREADFLVPILTRSSIGTQWVNQEIGFANGIELKVVPLVEVGIMPELKGFIHSQIDLPFKFLGHVDQPQREAAAFRRACKLWLKYLQDQHMASLSSTIEPDRVKSGDAYTTRVRFRGRVVNGFFDNYVEHLESTFRKWNWDRATIPAEEGRRTPSNTAPGVLNGAVDVMREYTWPTTGWPSGRYKIHVRLYTHPVPGETGRGVVAENVHDMEVY